MKKVILILAVFFATVSALAQDTVYLDEPRYLMPEGAVRGDSLELWSDFDPTINQIVTQKPATIYGIGMAMVRTTPSLQNLPMMGSSNYLMMLYDNFNMVDTTRVSNRELKDATRHHKLMDYEGNSTVRSYINGVVQYDTFDAVLEFYYANPIELYTNTIQYTIAACHPETFEVVEYPDRRLYRNLTQQYEYHLFSIVTNARIDGESYFRIGFDPQNEWSEDNFMVYRPYLMFPILTPPTLDTAECVRPPAPEMNCLDFDRNRAYVNFEVNPEVGDMEVVFGPYPGDPDDYVPIHFLHEDEDEGPWRATLDNLDSGACYAAWLRHQCYYRFTCHGDTTIWTDWSEPLVFNFCDTISDTTGGGSDPNDPSEGIAGIGQDPITLHPNPTSGELRIECGELSISTVELLDLQGRVLERQEPRNAQSSILNLQPYPVGTYIVRITTTEGTFTRRVTRK